MLNTCSIGRRWKSREGWSRPVLTGERGTLFPTLWWVGSRPVVVFSLDGKERCFLWSRRLVRRLSFASVVRFPDRHDRNRSRGWFRCRPPSWLGLAVHSGFAVVMAQVRRPVPFRTRKLRPGTAMVLHSRGCGRVARRRILSLGVPVELRLREPPFFVCCAGPPTGAHCPGGSRRAFPVARRPDYSTRREI